MEYNNITHTVPIRDWFKTHKREEVSRIFQEYRTWLEENIGQEYTEWTYIRGNLHATGIQFLNEDDLIAFKLRFEI